eukprot:scaffold26628_cov149-Skeletonema_menzelii.AAC.4
MGTTRSRHFVEVALEVQSNRPRRRVGWGRRHIKGYDRDLNYLCDDGNIVEDNSTANAATVGCFLMKEVERLGEGKMDWFCLDEFMLGGNHCKDDK